MRLYPEPEEEAERTHSCWACGFQVTEDVGIQRLDPGSRYLGTHDIVVWYHEECDPKEPVNG